MILAKTLEWKCDIGGEAASPRGPLGGELGTRERQEHEGNIAHPRRKCLEQVEHARRRDVDVVEDEHRRPIESERLHKPSRGEEQRLSIADAAVLADADQHRDVGRELGGILSTSAAIAALSFSLAVSSVSVSNMAATCFTCAAKAP